MGSIDVIDTTDYRIMDIEIFQTGGSNLNSSFFPDNSTLNKFKDILGFVSDHNSFKEKTYFETILKLDLTNQVSNSYFNQVDRTSERCKGDTENFKWLDNSSGNFTRNEIPGDGNGLDSNIVQKIKEDMSDMNNEKMRLTRGNVDGVKEYKKIMKNICKEIFKHQNTELHNTDDSKFMVQSLTNIDSELDNMTTYIDEQIRNNKESFIRDCSIDNSINTYYGNIVQVIYDYRNNDKFKSVSFSSSDIDHEKSRFIKLFLIVFYPYFVFNYIINSIALEEANPLTHQQSPRFFFFQRITVLASYIFMYYTLLTIFENLSSSMPQTDIIEAITDLNDHVLFKEKIPDETLSYHMMQEKSEQTRDSSLQMQQLGHTVSLLKTNLNKAAVYDARLGPILRNAKIHVILASLLMVITILGALVLMFIPQFGPQTLWIFLIVVIIISVIAFFYSLFRKAMR